MFYGFICNSAEKYFPWIIRNRLLLHSTEYCLYRIMAEGAPIHHIFIFTDSRGRGLEDLINKDLCDANVNVSVRVYPGARIHNLLNHIVYSIEHESVDTVFVMAGICDVTQRDRRAKSTFMRSLDTETHSTAITNSYKDLIYEIKQFRPFLPVIICPIVGINLATYNKEADRHPQQDAMNKMILNINRGIISINKENGVLAPWLSQDVHHCHGGRFRHSYVLLDDGCHPSAALKAIWAGKFKTSFFKNPLRESE